MASLNRASLIGHLGADPEIKNTQDGRKFATLSLATSETWRDKNTGEKREKTEWHRIVIFSEGLVGVAEQYLKKGAKAFVEGQLSTRKWQGPDGSDRYSTEIVLQGFNAKLLLLDRAQGSGYRTGGDGPADHGLDPDRASGATRQDTGQATNYGADLDDEIPF